jgi:hypothetical protein
MRPILILVSLAGLIPAAGAFAQSTAAPPAARTPPPPVCVTPDHRAFDFWVGAWDVSPTGSDRLVAHSLIERLYAGCAIRENWMPLVAAGDGGSLSSYDSDGKVWRQTWVDSSGARADFKGGIESGAMVLTGWWPNVLGPGKGALVRMTYSREAAGAVRQKGETSADQGKSWQPSFDFTYRPAR